MKEEDLRKALRPDAQLKKEYSELLLDRTEAYVLVKQQDSDYTRPDALAKRSGQYSGVVSELIELSVVRHARDLGGWSQGVEAPLHRYSAELYYPNLTSKVEGQEVHR